MNRYKIKHILQFSLYKNIQNKWFVLFNVLTFLSIFFLLNWSGIASLFTPEDNAQNFQVALLDPEAQITEAFLSAFESDSNIQVTTIPENTYTAETIPDDFAIIEVIPDEAEMFRVKVISKEGIKNEFYQPIQTALTDIRNDLFLQHYEMSSETLAHLQSDLAVERIMLSVDAEDSTAKELIKLFSSALTYLITIFIFSKMANEIAQEKQSKSSEYILTTVSAKEYLLAKILSNIAILLMQGLFLLVYYCIAILCVNAFQIATTDLTLSATTLSTGMTMDLAVYFLTVFAYNVLNLILLCIVQATLSAKTSSTSEAGNTVSLLTFLMMALYIATVYWITPYNKANLLLTILSCLPILSAYFVPAFMVIGQATTWQVVLSLGILILSIPVAFHFCAPIFKNGILDYRKRQKGKETKKDSFLETFFAKRTMKRVGFVVGFALLLYIGLQTILSLFSSFFLTPFLRSFVSETDLALWSQLLLQILSLVPAAALVLSYCETGTKPKRVMTGSAKVRLILIAIFSIFVCQFAFSLILYPLLGLDYEMTDMFSVSTASPLGTKLLLFVALAIVPAIVEEFFFRKALIDFTAPISKKFALLFSALLFGLVHMNLSQGFMAFLMGLLFGGIYLYTNDIRFTMLLHFLNNGFAALTMVLPEQAGYVLIGILGIVMLVGFFCFLLAWIRKSSRQTLLAWCKTKVPLRSLRTKYGYLFTDFTFIIAMLLILLMSVITENMLR